MNKPLLCLTMIVKNEARGIVETIKSVRDHVDASFILDTGSTDGTQDLALQSLYVGRVVDGTFTNFAETRNKALTLAEEFAVQMRRSTWILHLSGDAVVERADLLPEIVARAEEEGCIAVRLQLRNGGFTHSHVDLVKAGTECHFVGVVHEAMVAPGKVHDATASGLVIRYTLNEGRDANRWQTDRMLLESELDGMTPEQRQEATRTVFYLAQTYDCLGNVTRAISLYEDRVRMAGYDEERFIAQLRIARLKRHRKDTQASIVFAYWEASAMRPDRAEPLYWLSRYYKENGSPLLAYEIAARAAALPLPGGDLLFVNADVYEWRAKDDYAVAAYNVGRFAECIAISRDLLAGRTLPPEEHARVLGNIDESLRAIERERTEAHDQNPHQDDHAGGSF